MISPQVTNSQGIRRRNRNNARISKDLATLPVLITIPRWMRAWIDRQPESMGLLIEKALVEYYGAEPPEHVKEALRRHYADEQRKLDAKKEAK